MKKRLYLMRHGETLFNLQKKIQGWCDSPLTEKGRQQAEIAKKYFKQNQIELEEAHCSTSERASDTLEIITSLPYQRHKGLKEWNFGAMEAEHEYLNPALPYGNFFVQYQGEDELEVKARFTSTVQEIVDQSPHQQILIVAHGAVLAQFMRWERLTNQDVAYSQSRGNKNCCIIIFDYEDGKFTFVEKINHDFSELERVK